MYNANYKQKRATALLAHLLYSLCSPTNGVDTLWEGRDGAWAGSLGDGVFEPQLIE